MAEIDLDFADKLPDLPADELALEVYALLQAVEFDYPRFRTAVRMDDESAERLYDVALHGYANRWKLDGVPGASLEERVYRWKVITA